MFVLATLHQLEVSEEDKSVKVVAICHTRELAQQIRAEYERFSKYMPGVKVMELFGGVPEKLDKEKLKEDKPQIIVATPGRIAGFVKDKVLDVSKVAHFIVDECDRCLEMVDMRKDLQSVFVATPKKKQVMMFSATMSAETRALCKKFMQDPMEITVDDQTKLTLHGLLQYEVNLEETGKSRKLNDLLDVLEFNQVVIFVKNVQRARALDKLLNECGFPSIAIHSSMKQTERIEKFKEFKEFKKRICVSTDLFGRGIDIEKVNIVINYDFPGQSDQYLHRVGRAGRFGTKGLAISFVSSDEDKKLCAEVKERFGVQITECPSEIDPSSYMNA